MGELLLLSLSAESAGHLAVAIRKYRNDASRQGLSVPPQLHDLEIVMSRRAMQGQAGTPLADLWEVGNDRRMKRDMLTIAETAARLSFSTRTVKRRIAAGALPAVRDGGTTRIRVSDLTAYIESLGA